MGGRSHANSVQLVSYLWGTAWPSYFTAICLSFLTGETEIVMLYKNNRNFRNNKFVRNPLVCVWAMLLLMPIELQICPYNFQVFLCFFLRQAWSASESVNRSWTQTARTESKPCSTLSKKTFFDVFLPLGRMRWQDEESTEDKRFGTLLQIHRTTSAASSVAVLTKLMRSLQWQAASITQDTECSFWGVHACPFRLSSNTEVWGQCRDGKGSTSKVVWSGPACSLGLVRTHMVTPNFYPRIITQWSQILRIIFLTHFGCSLFTKNAAVLILLQNSVHLWILSPSLLPGFTWLLVRSSI